MTVIKQNTAEGGSNTTTVTTANSGGGSGTVFDLVNIPGGQALTYSSTFAQQGALSYKIVNDTSSAQGAIVRWGDTLALPSAAVRCYVYFPTATWPTVNATLVQFGCGTTGAITGAPRLALGTSGKLLVQDAAGTTVYTSTATLPTGTWVRLELYATPNASPTAGTIGGGFATGTGALTEQFTSSAVNAGTGNVGRLQVGKLSGTWSGQTFYVDNIALGDTAAFIGTSSFNAPPTATAAASATDNIEPYSTVTLTGTDADSDGTIASRLWTQTAGTSVSIATATSAVATFTAPGTINGDALSFQYAVTDNGGASGSAAVGPLNVLPATERAVIGGAEVPMQVRDN